jgi:hypothetical protein
MQSRDTQKSPRLWEKHINAILQSIGLKPTIHEFCLYSGYIGEQQIYFLHQVDDLAVAAATEEIGQQLIHIINNKVRIPIKLHGIITRYNAIDVLQTQHYIKISCKKYTMKLLKNHNCWLTMDHKQNVPTPLPSDNTYY